ncbi:hypothetical protein [Acetobacter fallax]|uniref:Flagellar assembly protein FliH/Type III secretion system HrpE domain-containing protein n=1 Tax=Acetobacter fallax TaxID=1737473 RepID=A0ABX0KE17_9PROT|nr:hypothetical protein [Acetobacter fallax]NHO33837.1 hypothetical protein [Acetobacter fallax]NHO37385.1 hypothetical protein [Acetobacter fallax]
MSSDIVIPYSNTAGILFAEDFDALPEEISSEGRDTAASADNGEHTTASSPAPTYTEEELQAAVATAVSNAVELTARQTRETVQSECNQTLENENSARIRTIEQALTSVQGTISSHLEEYASCVSKTLMDAVISAFPQIAESTMTLQAGMLLRDILPLFTGDFLVSLRINPDTEVLARNDTILARFFETSWLSPETDASLGSSDFAMSWPDGKISRRLENTVKTLLTTIRSSAASSSQKQDISDDLSVRT